MPKKRSARKKSPGRALWLRILVFSACLVLGLFFANVFNPFSHNVPPCANSISCIKDLSGTYEPNQVGVFMGKKVNPPKYLAQDQTVAPVLGDSTGTKHIFVNLATQTLTAYQGDKEVFNFPVSTGKWGPTPTGDFHIWVKLRYTRMTGGDESDGTFYDLPNVPYVMFFSNDEVPASRGYSIHGAYWHNNFGHIMSHGCVNMRVEDVAKVYEWADPPTQGDVTHATEDNPGTLITIFGTPPSE